MKSLYWLVWLKSNFGAPHIRLSKKNDSCPNTNSCLSYSRGEKKAPTHKQQRSTFRLHGPQACCCLLSSAPSVCDTWISHTWAMWQTHRSTTITYKVSTCVVCTWKVRILNEIYVWAQCECGYAYAWNDPKPAVLVMCALERFDNGIPIVCVWIHIILYSFGPACDVIHDWIHHRSLSLPWNRAHRRHCDWHSVFG